MGQAMSSDTSEYVNTILTQIEHRCAAFREFVVLSFKDWFGDCRPWAIPNAGTRVEVGPRHLKPSVLYNEPRAICVRGCPWNNPRGQYPVID